MNIDTLTDVLKKAVILCLTAKDDADKDRAEEIAEDLMHILINDIFHLSEAEQELIVKQAEKELMLATKQAEIELFGEEVILQ